ncbi:hypothetical protein [Sphingomonas sp. KR3-1]|uniref:hypothetical protein n=1 Tax=Sphingomonas sp. KR3-1 TaxID=3156611 RepID=UPI0032B38CF4
MAEADAAVLRWTNETDPGQAGPGEAQQLLSLGLDQRVVSVIEQSDEWARIRFGTNDFWVRHERLMPIGRLSFEVGDAVEAGGIRSVVRDIIWHFKDGEPNFYVERDGKLLAKRFKTSDLRPASNGS